MLRIAVGQISTESNHFAAAPCDLDLFRHTGYLYEGAELLQLAQSGSEVGGMLAVLQAENDVEIVPLLAARGNSSSPLSDDCYGYLRNGIIEPLRTAGQIDGVLLSHHGSMSAAHEDDPEGDIAIAVRALVGPGVPIVMTLDLHGNVTPRMVAATTAIVGYEQYPHYDVHETGVRAAALLMRVLRGEITPVMAHGRAPMIVTGFNGSTEIDGPFARLMHRAKSYEGGEVLSTSLFCVGSYIDVPDMGCSSIVVTNGDRKLAEATAKALADEFWQARHEFDVELLSIAEAVRRGRQVAGGPVLLLDTADTTGGGAEGDSIDLVTGLMEAGVTEACLAMVVDPEAAAACISAGKGAHVTLEIGHKLDQRWGTPQRISGTVVTVSDGRFQYTGGILGSSWVTMGPSAVLQVGSISLLIMSYPTYDWADEQYRAVGLDPAAAKFVGVKNMMNFRNAYAGIMKTFYVLDLPGPTPPDMRRLNFKRITRPVYPLDDNWDTTPTSV